MNSELNIGKDSRKASLKKKVEFPKDGGKDYVDLYVSLSSFSTLKKSKVELHDEVLGV